MRKMLIGFFIAVLLGFFTVSATDLPPEIVADKFQQRAEQLIDKGNYESAFKVMNHIITLQKEHNLTLPEEFHFKYAQVALKADALPAALDAVKKYLSATGKEGQFYKEALALLNEAEQMLPPVPEMVVIPAGSFKMGCMSGIDCSSYQEPVHEVRIASFEMSKYEVTFEEYDAFTDATGRERADDNDWGRGRRPVTEVSWRDAVAYARWLSSQTGKRYRLPTEAEWEYAARAGTTTAYSWGDSPGFDRANCEVCGSEWDDEQTAPVGSFEANGWGLHNMHGNAQEWVLDCWNDNYEGAPTDGSAWTLGDCSKRVVRGGAFNFSPRILRSAYRFGWSINASWSWLGFRVVRDL